MLHTKRIGLTAIVASSLFVGCSQSQRDYTGEVSTISDLMPCAGTLQAAEAMNAEQSQKLFGAKTTGAATVEALKQLRESGGIWLQRGFIVKFAFASGAYTALQVVKTPLYQGNYRGRSCWLRTTDIVTRVEMGDMREPVAVASDEYTLPPPTSKPMGTPVLPLLGQTYATTERLLGPWLWKNADNTQAPNIYNFPYESGRVQLQVNYSQTSSNVKRVSGINFDRFGGSLTPTKIKKRYIPSDGERRSIASIGGNIADVYGKQEADESDVAFVSPTFAKLETQWDVKACEDSSDVPGLLMVETTTNDSGGIDGLDIIDAALYYCAKQLNS